MNRNYSGHISCTLSKFKEKISLCAPPVYYFTKKLLRDCNIVYITLFSKNMRKKWYRSHLQIKKTKHFLSSLTPTEIDIQVYHSPASSFPKTVW